MPTQDHRPNQSDEPSAGWEELGFPPPRTDPDALRSTPKRGRNWRSS